jgi:hypothetical protein
MSWGTGGDFGPAVHRGKRREGSHSTRKPAPSHHHASTHTTSTSHHTANKVAKHHVTHAASTSKSKSLAPSQATLVAFDGGTWLATVKLLRSPQTTISGVPVSRAIPSVNMNIGAVLALLMFDAHNSSDAMVVGVYY